ncbi:MAG TPA: hypothetical protein VIQ31_29055 [Phormidium sp.]
MSNLELQEKLIEWGLLDPPADGLFGGQSQAALNYARQLCGLGESIETGLILSQTDPIPLRLDNSLASRIVRYMMAKDYHVSKGENLFNIVYLEGADEDGSPNSDAPNLWNDLRIVIEIKKDGTPKIIDCWSATTEPGRKYTVSPMNSGGAFRIEFGQYKSWQVGTHKDHEALVQVSDLCGFRDGNKDYARSGDKQVEGLFGVNQHWGYDMQTVEGASAGCLVGKTKTGHREFMSIIKRDRRFQANSGYTFLTTIIAGDDLAKKFPA